MTDTTRIKPSHFTLGLAKWVWTEFVPRLADLSQQKTGDMGPLFAELFNKAIDQGVISPPVDIKVDERGKPEYTEDGDLMLFARTTHDDLSKTTGYAHYKGQE